MLKRIVKMEFKEDKLEDFLESVKRKKEIILAFDGCKHLEFWQDQNDPCIVFTYSNWDSEHHLNLYRYSDFFKETWRYTKTCFRTKAEAWSFGEILMS